MAHIGMPTLKLKTSKTKTKRAGSFLPVAGEALEERWGQDPDINREMTKENIYTGFKSAQELYDYSKEHISELEEQLGHKIRTDTVKMVATIFKPSKDYMDTLSKDQQIQLLNDCLSKFKEIVREENIKSTVIHIDEQVPHMHVFWEPMTSDGRLCAKEALNLKLYHRMNEEIPKYLQSKGWKIEDAEMYDAEKMTEEEKLIHREEKKLRNRSSAEFKAQAEAKRLEEKIENQKAEIERITEAPSYEKYAEVIKENCKLKEEITQKNTIIEKLKAEVEKYKSLAEELGQKITAVAQKFGTKLMHVLGIEAPAGTLDYPAKEVTEAFKQMQDGVKSIDPKLCRVIPDNEQIGTYRVAYRGADGKYATVEGGFATREAADKFRKNLSEAALDMGEHIKDGLKHGMSQ